MYFHLLLSPFQCLCFSFSSHPSICLAVTWKAAEDSGLLIMRLCSWTLSPLTPAYNKSHVKSRFFYNIASIDSAGDVQRFYCCDPIVAEFIQYGKSVHVRKSLLLALKLMAKIWTVDESREDKLRGKVLGLPDHNLPINKD